MATFPHVRTDKKTLAALRRRRIAVRRAGPDVVLPPAPPPLKLPKHQQEKDNCGPASLRIVASFFGRDYTERQLAKMLGTNARFGTSQEALIKGAERLGAEVFAAHNSRITDLRYFLQVKRLPVIVGWYSPGRPRYRKYKPGEDFPWGHFSVAYHVSRTHIYLRDPDVPSGRRRLSLRRFKFLWWDTDSRRRISVRRWLMVARFPAAKAAKPSRKA